MKRSAKVRYIMIGMVSLLFTSQSFGKKMSVSEVAYFKRTCIKAGGHVGIRDGDYVCAGGIVKMPTKKKYMKQRNIKQTGKMKKKVPKEEAY